MNYDYIQKPDIDFVIRAALDAGATVSKTRFGEEGSIFINGRRLEDGELEELLLHPKPLTNADRIRSMTDEELADYLIRDVEAEAIRRAGRYLSAGEINRAVTDCLDWLKDEVNE